jgi:hypothetical protein
MADKFHSDTHERIETLSYTPGLQDSGDLEAGTRSITATSEASGIGNADYSTALTLPSPDDARLEVKRIAARLAVTIDSFDTATHLYCRVYVDAQDAGHLLFDEDWDSTGAKLDAVDTLTGTKETIFNLLKDGGEHTFYFFFWVNQANNAVVSLVQLWETVGSCSTVPTSEVYRLNFSGFMSLAGLLYRAGTGTPSARILPVGSSYHTFKGISGASGTVSWEILSFLNNGHRINVYGSVATDINYHANLYLTIRSDQ